MNTQERLTEDHSLPTSTRNHTQIRKYYNQESDDEDQPPALSDYALALLQKEQRENATRTLRQLPKRVNFTGSANRSRVTKVSDLGSNNLTNNQSLHTNLSEYETIFTKDVNDDFNSYVSNSSIASNDNKTPKSKLTGSTTNTSNLRTRSSVRRSKIFGSLGPPKRASYAPSNETDSIQEDTPMKDAVPTSTTTPVKHAQTNSTVTNNAVNNEPIKTIDFEGLNPYQYSKKYNLPTEELPKIVKLYFQQQKLEAKESLNSPIRLKEVIHHNIEQQIKESPKYESRSNAVYIHSDKENIQTDREPINSIERSTKRQPLRVLDERKQDQLQNMQKLPSSKSQKSANSSIQEYHYKEVEPLKAPDYSSKTSSRIITVNGKQYEKLELLGKGGSSKVFKVKSLNNKVYAVKKIVFDEFDDASISGFKGEIALLTKLRDQKRVVTLVDHSLAQGSLLLVMECGDIDLSHVLSKRLDLPFDAEFVRFHANEVLKCVQAVHDAGIVHSDLKPANFLFVKGILKIIDFGIANAVPEHTVNIYREAQIGTPNYMAPEALIDNNQSMVSSTDHKSTWRVGKPSDIWSCGCIIYQMIYGRPPYGGYQGSQRLLAIMNPDIKITYPDKGLGGVKVPGTAIETIQSCLIRDPSKRWTAQEVLDGPFLKPRVVSEQFINDLVKNAITYGVSKTSIEDDELKVLADDVWKRVSQLSL